jgi:hypothetical protein
MACGDVFQVQGLDKSSAGSPKRPYNANLAVELQLGTSVLVPFTKKNGMPAMSQHAAICFVLMLR